MPEPSPPLTAPSKRLRANSKGEELFLVHLQRTSAPDPHPEDAEDDHDYEEPRHPQKTVGEELFEVHLKRSQGLDPDYDVDPNAEHPSKNAAADIEIEGKGHYNLRTRNASFATQH